MRNKIINLLVWILKKIEIKNEQIFYANEVRNVIVLPDHLSGKVKKILIEFDEPVLPAKVMENIDPVFIHKNCIPERQYKFYDLEKE